MLTCIILHLDFLTAMDRQFTPHPRCVHLDEGRTCSTDQIPTCVHLGFLQANSWCLSLCREHFIEQQSDPYKEEEGLAKNSIFPRKLVGGLFLMTNPAFHRTHKTEQHMHDDRLSISSNALSPCVPSYNWLISSP